MSLLFDASTELVNHGSDSSIDDIQAGTMFFWHYPTSFSGRGHMFRKNGGTHLFRMTQETNGTHEFNCTQPTSGINLSNAVTASPATLNVWQFVAVRWDTSGAAADQEMYIGELDSIASEVSSYLQQSVGTGTHDDAAGTMYVGSRGDTTAPYQGRIAFFAMYDKYLSVGKILQQQFHLMGPVDSNCVMLVNYGFNGPGTQTDWSGNGNGGTVTGATVAPHVPVGVNVGFEYFSGLPGVAGHPTAAPGVPYAVTFSNEPPYEVTSAPAPGAILTASKGIW